jgi:hypothetical protein
VSWLDLPPQVIYQGKTDQCHAKFNFPEDWHTTHTENHWDNTSTSYEYVDNIITPYVLDVKDNIDLPVAKKSLIILDFFSAQLGEDFRNYMLSNNLVFVFVPAGCTSKLQSIYLSVQKCVKDRMRKAFEDHYAEKVAESIQDKTEVNIDLAMTTLKPLSVRWLVSAIDYLKANPKIVYNGFHNAGIAERLAYEFDDEQIP